MSPFTRFYYTAKPFLPRRVRNGLRRAHARRVRARSSSAWPILPGSERPPQNWSGWPDGKKFAVVLTHDVESQRGYDRIPQVAALETEMGYRSSFNLIPEGPYRVAPELRARLTADGFEVGIHDLHHDGRLYDSREEFSRRAHRINRYVKEWGVSGFRSAYMHHNLEWLGELDVAYDASTFDTDPFEPQPDGVGTIFPFWVPRNATLSRSAGSSPSPSRSPLSAFRSPLLADGFVELPYTLVQDSTLFLFLGEKTIACWKRKIDWIAGHGGMVLLNTHPDYLNFQDQSSEHEFSMTLYRELLTYLRERYQDCFWQALPREMAAWYKNDVFRREDVMVGSPKTPTTTSRYSEGRTKLVGKRAAVILYSDFPWDPRPRRAAQALADSGVHVDLLCLKADPDDLDHEVIKGVSVYRVPSMHDREGGLVRYIQQYLTFFLRSLTFLTRRAVMSKYDLVHVHNMPDFLVFSALLAKMGGARVILDLHDPMPELFRAIYRLPVNHWMIGLLKEIERLSIRTADRVLTPNVAFQRIFESRSCGPGKIDIVMNSPEESIFRDGISPAQLPALPFGGKPFRILHHGSIVHRHGLDIAVEAIAIARRRIPHIQFLICGRGNAYLDDVLAKAARVGLADVVVYLGSKSQPEIASIVAACDLGVIPNRLSAFTAINMPTRIFEYLSMDRPVISPSTIGIRDYFDDANMLFFEPGNPADLARQMVWACENPSSLAAIVQNGKKVYREQVWERQREQFLDIVEDLLSR